MMTKLTGKLILPLLLLASLPNFAQQGRGTILGTVTDASGAPVAGALIKVTNTATNSGLETRSTGEGLYQAPNLAVGDYTVTVEKQGFRMSSAPACSSRWTSAHRSTFGSTWARSRNRSKSKPKPSSSIHRIHPSAKSLTKSASANCPSTAATPLLSPC